MRAAALRLIIDCYPRKQSARIMRLLAGQPHRSGSDGAAVPVAGKGIPTSCTSSMQYGI